jgi:ribosome-associated heat shock protein Hsp15
MNAEDHAGVRLDKWLWAARFYKSRTLAVTAVEMGRVHLNNERVKPARLLRVGDKVSIQKDQIRTEVFVRFLGEVRRSAPLAKLMYEETIESLFARQTATERKKLYAEPAQNRVGRPTKRERRALTRIEPLD